GLTISRDVNPGIELARPVPVALILGATWIPRQSCHVRYSLPERRNPASEATGYDAREWSGGEPAKYVIDCRSIIA
ncbi:MAG: hypothetical protein IH859_10455, partial [Chloroflexi bacterium]|nr:hypothetical protein [Chloroflexota bacterium]